MSCVCLPVRVKADHDVHVNIWRNLSISWIMGDTVNMICKWTLSHARSNYCTSVHFPEFANIYIQGGPERTQHLRGKQNGVQLLLKRFFYQQYDTKAFWFYGRFSEAIIGVRGGGGGGGCSPPRIFQIAIFGQKKIFGQNHLIFGQAMDKIFGQLTSAPLNETGPVRPWRQCHFQFFEICHFCQCLKSHTWRTEFFPLFGFPE